MVTVKLDKIEAAALKVVAESEGVTSEQLLRDLIRDAAIHLVTGRPRRYPGDIRVEQGQEGDEDGSQK